MEAELVFDCRCELGENPLWRADEQALYFTDIPQGRLWRFHPASGESECFYQGETVGGFTFQRNGALLLFQRNKISELFITKGRVHTERDARLIAEGIDPDMKRFNDVIADPQGRVFAGSIGSTRENGGLYRVDRDGTVTLLFKGTGCSNGMAFTADLKQFYWTCSTTKTIFRFAYDEERGTLSDRTVFYQAPEGEGTPDGLTIDDQGNIWTARWGGSSIIKLTPEGYLATKISIPASAVTSCIFGGPGLRDLYVTTAAREGAEDHEGSVFRIKNLAQGFPEHHSQIRDS